MTNCTLRKRGMLRCRNHNCIINIGSSCKIQNHKWQALRQTTTSGSASQKLIYNLEVYSIVSKILQNQTWVFAETKSHWRHIQGLQYILKLEVTSLFVEPFHQLVPRIIKIKRLSGLQKPFCFIISELAGENYISTNKYHVFAVCKFCVVCNSKIWRCLSSSSFIIFQPSENYVRDLHCNNIRAELWINRCRNFKESHHVKLICSWYTEKSKVVNVVETWKTSSSCC